MRRAAFSLIELLVVIAVIIILSFVSFPYFGRWLENQRLKGFVYELSTNIGYARDYSRRNGERVIVAIVEDSPQNWTGNSELDPVLYLIFVDKNKNVKYDDGDVILSYGKSSLFKVIKNTLKKKCFSDTGKCIIFLPVGPPKLGAVPCEVKFQSSKYDDIIYGIKFRGITGITEVIRG